MKSFKTTLTAFIVAAVMLVTFVTSGCPQRSIDQAKASSARMAGYANAGVNVTRDLYQSRLLTLGQKDAIADGFIALAKAGQTFDAMVIRVEAQYGPTAPPKSEIDKLSAVFDVEVVDRFAAVLRAIGLSGIPERYKTVIEAIRQAVLIVAGAFGNKSIVAAKIAASGG